MQESSTKGQNNPMSKQNSLMLLDLSNHEEPSHRVRKYNDCSKYHFSKSIQTAKVKVAWNERQDNQCTNF